MKWHYRIRLWWQRHFGLIEYCHRCGVTQPLVWHADNALWAQVAPPGGVLCPRCFTDKIDALGLPGIVIWEPRVQQPRESEWDADQRRESEAVPTWPEGISDGLITPCSRCGQVPSFDYMVTDRVWNLLTRNERGVVCLPCLDRIGVKVGVDVSKSLVRVQWTGVGKTVVLEPHFTHRYTAKESEAVPTRCGRCGQKRESALHMVDSKNIEIHHAAHAFVAAPQPEPQDERCHRCGNTYPEVWYAHDGTWPEVVGIPNDGKGLFCPRCFNVLAVACGLRIHWVAHREWPVPAPLPDTERQGLARDAQAAADVLRPDEPLLALSLDSVAWTLRGEA